MCFGCYDSNNVGVLLEDNNRVLYDFLRKDWEVCHEQLEPMWLHRGFDSERLRKASVLIGEYERKKRVRLGVSSRGVGNGYKSISIPKVNKEYPSL
jgi:hypothetical protein